MIHISTLVVLLALCGVALSVRNLNTRSLKKVRGYAKNLLKRAANKDRQAYIAANTSYANLRNDCKVTVNNTKTECSKCALQACKSDRDQRCPRPQRVRPNFWQGVGLLLEDKVLDPVADFFEDDVGGFFKDDVGGAFEDVGDWFADDFADFWADDFAGGIERVAIDVGDWFEDDFADFWADDCAGGIEEAANDVADFFKDDFAGGIVDAAEDVGDWFADDFADFWTDDVGGAFEDFGNAIGGIFGKRRRRSVTRGDLPSCDRFQTKESAARACLYYKHESVCSSCTQHIPTICPELTAAGSHLNTTRDDYRRWRFSADGTQHKVPGRYQINSISYDPRRYDYRSDGWKGVTATTKLFGNTFRFTLENAVDVHNTTALAPIVFHKTLQEAGRN